MTSAVLRGIGFRQDVEVKGVPMSSSVKCTQLAIFEVEMVVVI